MYNIFYIPCFSNQKIEFAYKNQRKSKMSENGTFDLTDFLPNTYNGDDFLVVKHRWKELLNISLKDFDYIEREVKFLNTATCASIEKDGNGYLRPGDITKTFKSSDKFIIVYLELENLMFNYPINITISKQGEFLYKHLDIIPFSSSSDSNYHRTYSHHIAIDYKSLFADSCETKGVTLCVSSILGKIILNQEILIHKTDSNRNLYKRNIFGVRGCNFDISL